MTPYSQRNRCRLNDLGSRSTTLRVVAVALLVITGSGAPVLAEESYAGQYHRVLRAQDMAQDISQNAPQNTWEAIPAAPQGSVYGGAAPRAQTAQAQPRKASSPGHREKPLMGFISELRGGFFDHDSGIFGRNKEGGNDFNGEILFVSPGIFDFMWSPRPMLGGTVNDDGNTSHAYGGLTWEWWPLNSVFIDFSLGFAVHDGNIDDNELGRKDLGSRVLFRESLELGWNFYNKDRISVILDHISHGHAFGDPNEGMDSLGLRYGYRF